MGFEVYAMSLASEPLLDKVEQQDWIEAKLKQLAEETDEEFAASIVAQFRTSAPGMLTELRDALERADLPLATRIAHSLKGNCATFGLARLAAVLQEVEGQCRNAAPPAPQYVEPLTERYRVAETQLQSAIDTVLNARL
jgi:HPt (histidine-containing phosphotransfer) domain-containing protein